jgi:hypothetical protein
MDQLDIHRRAQAFGANLVKEVGQPHDCPSILVGLEAATQSANWLRGIALATFTT